MKTTPDSNVYHITACLSKKYECDRNWPVSFRLRFQTLYINYFLRILNLKLLQSVVKCRPNQTMWAQYFPPLHIFECNCSLFALWCRENMKTGRHFRFFDGALNLRVPVERSLQPSEEWNYQFRQHRWINLNIKYWKLHFNWLFMFTTSLLAIIAKHVFPIKEWG